LTRRSLGRGVLAGLLVIAPLAAVTWTSLNEGTRAQETAPAVKKPKAALVPDQQVDQESDNGGSAMDLHLSRVLIAAIALPVAAVLGAALALRPRRRGTPHRSAPIVQTQVILAVIGALVMLVVGSSLARAFGVVGAAGLVRYRAKVQDPKDAGVMLSTLAVGLSAGVGLYLLSAFAAAFIMGVLWIIESFEPEAFKLFHLKVTTDDAKPIQGPIEALLRRQKTQAELRTSSAEELSYEVHLPMNKGTDALTKAILEIPGAKAVDWAEQKKKPVDES
jgi:hypothetical protein